MAKEAARTRRHPTEPDPTRGAASRPPVPLNTKQAGCTPLPTAEPAAKPYHNSTRCRHNPVTIHHNGDHHPAANRHGPSNAEAERAACEGVEAVGEEALGVTLAGSVRGAFRHVSQAVPVSEVLKVGNNVLQPQHSC